MSREKFVQTAAAMILSLPQDLKAVMRLIEDADIDDPARTACAGALLHVLSKSNSIPGVRGLLAYLDDALVLRLVLRQVAASSPEALAAHQGESAELLDNYAAQLDDASAFLGPLLAVLERAAKSVSGFTHEGHSAELCAKDTEATNWLYDEISEALLRMDFPEDEVLRAAKQIDQIVPPLRQRLAAK